MEIEELAKPLAMEGWYVHLQRRSRDWFCDLRNNVASPHFTPQASGETPLIALQRAIANRDERLAASK